MRIADIADRVEIAALKRHQCEACGQCCRTPGYAYLYPEDISRLAESMSCAREDFVRRYCVVVLWHWEGIPQYRIALRSDPGTHECVFLRGNLCSVHALKPLFCRAGPAGWLWVSNPDVLRDFIEKSPSFRANSDEGRFQVLDELFEATWIAEVAAAGATSVAKLASQHSLAVDVIAEAEVVGFEAHRGEGNVKAS